MIWNAATLFAMTASTAPTTGASMTEKQTSPQRHRRNKVLSSLPGTARQVSEALVHHYTTVNDDLHILQHKGLVTHDGGKPRVWSKV